jgi:prepilin-type N-terminal cleavage/methylation domain-containing protein
MTKQHNKRQAGFTILELMIATSIVSVILLMVTTVMIGIQSLYYKGINQENVQNNVRTIVSEVDQEIQTSIGSPKVVTPATTAYTFNASFNHQAPTSYQVQALCIGSVRYTYIIGLQVGSGSNQVPQALWRDSTPEAGCASGVPNISNPTFSVSDDLGGTEYIAAGARLTAFQITQQSDGNYQVQASVAVGQDNLLNTNIGYNAQCIGNSGDQFCATASLSSETGPRLD